MILGYAMIALGLTGFVGMDIAYPIYKEHISKKNKASDTKDKNEISLSDRGKTYTQLFTNMGLMKGKDWIKVVRYDSKKCYYMTTFVLSDSLSISTFIKRLPDIKNKLGVPHLEIYPHKTYMCFRVRRNNIPLEPYTFTKPKRQSLIQLGLDLDGHMVYWDLTQDPHLGIFAESGAGKSRFTHTIICSILQGIPSATHYMVDCKNGIELGRYEALPNVIKVATNPDEAKPIIAEIEQIADNRYLEMKKEGYTDYNEYAKDKPRTKMKRMFLWLEEMADLVDDRKDSTKNGKVEGYDAVGTLVRLSRKLRACGISMICITQRPTVDFIPASLKANLGAFVGMRVFNERNSQLIIDDVGLEELERSQCIGKVGGKMTFFLSYEIDNKVIKGIIASILPDDKVKFHVDNVDKEEYEPPKNVIDVNFTESPLK